MLSLWAIIGHPLLERVYGWGVVAVLLRPRLWWLVAGRVRRSTLTGRPRLTWTSRTPLPLRLQRCRSLLHLLLGLDLRLDRLVIRHDVVGQTERGCDTT